MTVRIRYQSLLHIIYFNRILAEFIIEIPKVSLGPIFDIMLKLVSA